MSQNPTTAADTHQPKPRAKRENFTPEQVEYWRSKLMGKEISANGESMALQSLRGHKRAWEHLLTVDDIDFETVTKDDMRTHLDEASRELAAKEQKGLSADCIDVTELPAGLQVVPEGRAVTCDFRFDRIRAHLDLDGRVYKVFHG